MMPALTPAPRGARWRARVAARLRCQSGDALIEVLITAVLVALIAGATLTGYAQVEHLGGLERHRNEAAALAQQDEARLRGLTITELSSSGTGTGNTTSSQTVDGTVYTITSASKFVSGSTAVSSCTTGPVTTTADEVETSSSVTWSGNNNVPIVIHGLVTPDEGGSLIVTAVNNTGTTGLAGVTATPTGPTTIAPLTTDSNGCAVFGGLDGGTYNVAFSDPGYVDVNGNSPPASQSVTVVPTETAKTTELELGQPGTISTGFTTTYTNGSGTTTAAATDDQFTAANSGITIGYRQFGTDSTSTNNTFTAGPISTGATMFPFLGGYSVFAGGCPVAPPAAGVISSTVTAGATNNVTLPEPAMIVLPYVAASNATEVDDPAAAGSSTTPSVVYSATGWTHRTGLSTTSYYDGTESVSSTASATVTFTVPALANDATSGGATSITLLDAEGSGDGYLSYSVNGGATTNVNTYSSSAAYGQTEFTVSGLNPLQSNSVVVTVTGTKGNGTNSGSGAQVEIDAFTYVPATLLTTKADVTVTDTDTGCGNNEDYPPSATTPNLTTGALANPGLPYGHYTVCVDNGTNHDTVTGVTNTSFTGSNYVTAPILSSQTGYGTGKCT
jgi:Tfp pilus assembly protein PilV